MSTDTPADNGSIDNTPAKRRGWFHREAAAPAAPDVEVARAIRKQTTAGAANMDMIAELDRKVIDQAFEVSLDLVGMLERHCKYEPPPLARAARGDSERGHRMADIDQAPVQRHLIVKSKEINDLITGECRELGFNRVSCYVKRAMTGTDVARYDIIVPTWNGMMVFDPAASWGGPEEQWLGFRPADRESPNKEFSVMKAAMLPVQSTDPITMPDNAYSLPKRPGKPYHYEEIQDPEWAVHYEPPQSTRTRFVSEASALKAKILAEQERVIQDRLATLDVGRNLLELDAADEATEPAPERAEPATAPAPAPPAQQAAPRPRRAGPEDVNVVE